MKFRFYSRSEKLSKVNSLTSAASPSSVKQEFGSDAEPGTCACPAMDEPGTAAQLDHSNAAMNAHESGFDIVDAGSHTRIEPQLPPPQNVASKAATANPQQEHRGMHQTRPHTPPPNTNQRPRPEQLRPERKTGASEGEQVRFPAPDYERLRTLAALYNAPRPQRSPLRRAMLTMAIFAIGAALGLAGVWWTTTSGGKPATALQERIAPPSAFTSPGRGEQSLASSARGIDPSELPYDGAAQTPGKRLPAVPKTGSGELPYSELSSGDGGAGQDSEQPDAANARNNPPPATAETNPAPSVKRGEKTEAQARSIERKSAKASQRYRSAQRATTKERGATEREIERIRKQADEELKKKPELRREVEEARVNSRTRSHARDGRSGGHREAGIASRTRTMLARCERSGNFIRREQCKWRLCSGMWGKNGCPAYAHTSQY